MEDFKSSMSEIPCSYFNYGKGECPFWNSCFYLHILEDGTDYEYDVQVKYYNENGELVVESEKDKGTFADMLGFL